MNAQNHRLTAVVRVPVATLRATGTGENRDLGSIFIHEIRLRSCWRPLLLTGKSYKNYLEGVSETTSSWYKADLESLLPISEFMNFTRLFTAVTESPIKVGKMNA